MRLLATRFLFSQAEEHSEENKTPAQTKNTIRNKRGQLPPN